MPRTGYQTCETIMKDLHEKGIKYTVSWNELHKAIMRNAGITPRIFQQYVEALLTMEFIRRDPENGYRFFIVADLTPELQKGIEADTAKMAKSEADVILTAKRSDDVEKNDG